MKKLMEAETQQAQEVLQAIAWAETAARRNGPNNGVVPLVWGAVVLTCMVGYDILPILWASGTAVAAALAASAWTRLYQRRLPVKPRTRDKPWLFGVWGAYHAAVLMGGIALGTHGWQTDCARPGTFTLIGILDAVPLFWVGWQQRRACGKSGRELQ